MQFLAVILLGISTNLDNMLVGISYGLQRKKITLYYNLIIGFISAAATCFFCFFSSYFTRFANVSNIIGGCIIIFMGVSSIISVIRNKEESYEVTEFTRKEVVVLGTGLAINCIPVAFGAGLTGIPTLPATISVGVISCAVIAIGNIIGLQSEKMRINPKWLSTIGGIIMISLGVGELFL